MQLPVTLTTQGRQAAAAQPGCRVIRNFGYHDPIRADSAATARRLSRGRTQRGLSRWHAARAWRSYGPAAAGGQALGSLGPSPLKLVVEIHFLLGVLDLPCLTGPEANLCDQKETHFRVEQNLSGDTVRFEK